jgi:hypothetical protein
VAHLAVLDDRPSLYAARGYGSLFDYCTQVLRLSEDAACNRIHAARAGRDFPMILDLLASGAMSLSSVRLLRPHLTPENHEAVLARAGGRSRRQIEALVAELAPRPDVPSSVRKLPMLTPVPAPPTLKPTTTVPSTRAGAAIVAPSAPPPPIAPPLVSTRRPIIETTSPDRYRVQFTIGKESHDKLRRVQDLLRREIPDGDPAAIFDRALSLLLEKVEKTKVAQTTKPRTPRPIRPGTDWQVRTPVLAPRDIPRQVQRAAWRRDGGQCAASSLRTDTGALNALSWSSITFGRMHWAGWPRSRTSRSVVGATTNTRQSGSSALAVLPSHQRRSVFNCRKGCDPNQQRMARQ